MSDSRRLSTLLGHLKASAPTSEASDVRRYRYSLDAGCEGVLTAAQRQHFEDHGYIVVKGLVSQRDLDLYRERFKQICTKQVKVDDDIELMPNPFQGPIVLLMPATWSRFLTTYFRP